MKKLLLAASVIVSTTLYGQQSFPWLQGIEGCFTNNYLQASIDFSGGTLPSGTERAKLYLSEKTSNDTVVLYSSVLPIYTVDKKAATIDFLLADSVYKLLETPDESEGYGNKWRLIISIENALGNDTVWTGISSITTPKDSIRLQTSGFFVQVLNIEQHTFDRPFDYQWSKDNITLSTVDTTTLLVLTEGAYSLFLQGQHCSDTYSIYFNPIAYEEGILIVPFLEDASYQWYYKSVLLEGANSNKYEASQVGEYKVEVTFPANYGLPNTNTRMEAANVGVYKFNVTDVVTDIKDSKVDPVQKTIVGIYTLLGESVSLQQAKRGAYIYQYKDGSTRKVMVTE